MKRLIYVVPVFLLVFMASNVFGQILFKRNLSKQPDSIGIADEYQYRPKGSHSYISLRLYKNGNYYYEEGSLTNVLFNEGKWRMLNNELILFDKLDKSNLPVNLICLDKIDTTYSFIVQVVKNLKGQYLTDGFVYINNDSNQCLPFTATCLGKYKSIDSLKVVFENGYKSKWIPVPCNEYKQLALTLQSNISMSGYTALRYSRFRVFKSYLKPKE